MIDADETLVQITAPHFTAGLVVKNERVIVAANILSYMRGWSADQVRAYVKRKNWRAVVVPPAKANHPSLPLP